MTMKLHFLSLLSATAFNTKAGWKMTEDGKIETKDGNPIWIDANGGETTMDGSAITRLNGEAKALRTRAETAESKVEAFKDLDPELARKAVETVKNIDAKKLIDAGEVETVKQQIATQYQTQIAEKDKALATLQSEFDNERVRNIFAGSDFIRERIAVPTDMFEATFRKNVRVKDGKIEYIDAHGAPLYSKKDPTQHVSDPNEAFELMVERHPQKDVILKADTGTGTGNNGNGGSNKPGARRMGRSEFAKLAPAQQAEFSAKVRSGEAQLVD